MDGLQLCSKTQLCGWLQLSYHNSPEHGLLGDQRGQRGGLGALLMGGTCPAKAAAEPRSTWAALWRYLFALDIAETA